MFLTTSASLAAGATILMHRLHLHPSHASGSRSASPLIFSRTVDVNGQISPPLSHHGSVAASPILPDSFLIVSGLQTLHQPTVNVSKYIQNSSIDLGRSRQSVSEPL